jgi:hypothetical protein
MPLPLPMKGWPIWGKPMALLAVMIFSPLLLLPTPLAPLAWTWAFLLAMAIWGVGVIAFIGAIVGTDRPVLLYLERLLRSWVARFAPDPGALWVQWAREAHHATQAHWCLERAAGLGGAEGLFQEGLAYFDGGFGAGGQIAGADRMRRAAQLGHPEAAFWHGESLRTGRGGPKDPAEALDWYRRSAAAGFGPAAAWLAQAHAQGDGVAADSELARRWSEVAGRLGTHPALSRSVLRHDAAPEDPLIRAGGQVVQRLEATADRVIAHRAGRWGLGVGAILLAGLGLGVPATFFLVGASGLFFLPLLMLAPPVLMLAWQAWRLRREMPRQGRDRLREAAEAGDPEACFQLGVAYRRGTPQLPRDEGSATAWFRRAAEAGHREAMQALVQAYLGGHGVVRDPREAARWTELLRQSPQ